MLELRQPKNEEITKKLRDVICGVQTREAVADWASEYIRNDDIIEVTDLEAWEYLVTVSGLDLMVSPGKYLFSTGDVQTWIEGYSIKNTN